MFSGYLDFVSYYRLNSHAFFISNCVCFLTTENLITPIFLAVCAHLCYTPITLTAAIGVHQMSSGPLNQSDLLGYRL